MNHELNSQAIIVLSGAVKSLTASLESSIFEISLLKLKTEKLEKELFSLREESEAVFERFTEN